MMDQVIKWYYGYPFVVQYLRRMICIPRKVELRSKATYDIMLDYHPFGMVIEERSFSSAAYRFGFNGHEQDDEVSGSGNTLDFGARVYNPRIGTWHSIDPMWKQFPFSSAYVFGLNSPICLIDPDGRYIKPGNDASASKLKGVLIQVFGSEDVLNQFLVSLLSKTF